MDRVPGAPRRRHRRAAVERRRRVGDERAGRTGRRHLALVELPVVVHRDPPLVVGDTAAPRVPVRDGRKLGGVALREVVRRPVRLGHVREVDEHLDLLEPHVVGRPEQRVVEVVAVQGLVVVGGTRVLRPALDRGAAEVEGFAAEERRRHVDDLRVHGQQVELDLVHRERVDAAELVAVAGVALRIDVVVERVGRRELAGDGFDRRCEVAGVEVRGQDHEAVRPPGIHR